MPRRERLLELDPRRARVPTDEHAAASGPQRDSLAQFLDELGRQALADDPADPSDAEVPRAMRRDGYRLENWGALRALCRPAFLRSTMRASRVRKPARFKRNAQLGIEIDERARDTVPHRACLAARAAAVHAHANVVATLELGDLQRRERRLPVHRAREVLLDRAPVEPRRAVARAKDHARDRRLPLAGSLVLRDLCRSHVSPPAAAAWAPAPRADVRGRRRSSAW